MVDVRYPPGVDIGTGNWSTVNAGSPETFSSCVDEVVADDTDFVQSSENPVDDTIELQFVGTVDPQTTSGHHVRYRIRGDSGQRVVVSLICVTELIKSWEHDPAPPEWTDFDQELQPDEAARITDYSDLRLRLVANAAGGGDTFEVSVGETITIDSIPSASKSIPASTREVISFLDAASYPQDVVVPSGADLIQYQLTDGPSGPTKGYWNKKISGTLWSNAGGDWLDNTAYPPGPQPQGTTYYARFQVVGAQCPLWKTGIDVTALVKRWRANGLNRGMLLRTAAQDWNTVFAGRLYSDPTKKPYLIVNTDGPGSPFTCQVTATCNVLMSSTNWNEGRQQFSVSRASANGLLQFDLSAVVGLISSATLNLYALSLNPSYSAYIDVYEINPPLMILGGGGVPPTLGIAQGYDNDVGIENHPSVLFHGTFDTVASEKAYTAGGFWDYGSSPGLSGAWTRVYDDVLGSWVMQGSYLEGSELWGGGLKKFLLNEVENNNRGHDAGSGKPVYRPKGTPPRTGTRLMPTQDGNGNWITPQPTMYLRSYLYLDETYGDTNTSCKGGAAIGGQFGSFSAYGGERIVTTDTGATGYFTDAFGNGTSSTKAIRGLWQYDNNDSPTVADYYNFQGWSMRCHIDQDWGEYSDSGNPGGPLDGNAYNGKFYEYRMYAYEMDGVSANGVYYRTSRGLAKNKWYCVEMMVTTNTIAGPLDADDNGTANPDGVVKMWIDGVEVMNRTNVRVTRNIWFGIEYLWFDWYHGGTGPACVVPWQEFFRYGDIVGATEYIGPKKVPLVLPDWVPTEPNTVVDLTVADKVVAVDGGGATFRSAIVTPNYSGDTSRKLITDYSCQRGNPYFGAYGALVCFGGGHSATNNNSVIVIEAVDAGVTWKRMNSPVNFSGVASPPPSMPWDAINQTGAQNPGDPTEIPYNVTDSAWGETLQWPGGPPFDPVQPQTCHSRDVLEILPPEKGGAANGSLLFAYRDSVNYDSIPGNVQAAHRMDFNDTTVGGSYFVRASNQTVTPNTNGIGGATAYDSKKNRIWIISQAGNQEGEIRYFDVATGNYGRTLFRTGALNKAVGLFDSACLNYDPAHDALIYTCSTSAPGNMLASYMLLDDPAGGWHPVVFSSNIPNATGGQCPFGYIDSLYTTDGVGRWILLSRNSTPTTNYYYEIVIPSDISGTWVVTPHLVNGTLPRFYICGKLTFLPKLRCFLHVVYNSSDALMHVYAFRPYGT